MQSWKKIILLLIVLLPSFFFLSRAFGGNTATVEEGKLIITGAGGMEISLRDIQSAEKVAGLPELSGTGGFSFGWIKKGNFLRASDQQKIRVIKNSKTPFIHLVTDEVEVYFNLGSVEKTEEVYKEISESQRT